MGSKSSWPGSTFSFRGSIGAGSLGALLLLAAALPLPARATEANEAPPLLTAVEVAPRQRSLTAQRAQVAEVPAEAAPLSLGSRQPMVTAEPALAAVEPSPAEEAGERAGGLDVAVPAAPRSSHGHLGLLFGVAGLTQPIHAELVAKPVRWLSAGFGIGGLPASLGDAVLSAASVQGASLTTISIEGALQAFPFGGSFFLGAAFGHLGLSAAASTKAGPVQIDISSLYFAPRLGWLAVFDSGFSLGLDLGAQLPISPQVSSSGARQAAANVESLARTLAALPLPTLSIRMGWLL